ncbi:MAG: PIG-L family deacetylase, partial [Candidatus Thermoplasmatota archaeon]|nr:PIG-L family deacetylase [Candidatus Thermoplasmatota archaeon]
MVWKDGKRPEQYLFTITQDFSKDWKALKDNAKQGNRNISDVLREAVTSKIKQPRTKSALVLSPHTDDAELGCGGTIAKLVEEGWKVHVIYFSAVSDRYPDLVDEAAESGSI